MSEVKFRESADGPVLENGLARVAVHLNRGTFDITAPFTNEVPGAGRLVVYESSAEDGRPIHVVEIPVRLEP